MMPKNTKARHEQLQAYAMEHLRLDDDDRELLNQNEVIRGLMAQFGCTKETARINVAKAARRKRGLMVKAWGGYRPGAGRPNIREQVQRYIDESGLAHLETRDEVNGVVFHDEMEFIPLSELQYDAILGFNRRASCPAA